MPFHTAAFREIISLLWPTVNLKSLKMSVAGREWDSPPEVWKFPFGFSGFWVFAWWGHGDAVRGWEGIGGRLRTEAWERRSTGQVTSVVSDRSGNRQRSAFLWFQGSVFLLQRKTHEQAGNGSLTITAVASFRAVSYLFSETLSKFVSGRRMAFRFLG